MKKLIPVLILTFFLFIGCSPNRTQDEESSTVIPSDITLAYVLKPLEDSSKLSAAFIQSVSPEEIQSVLSNKPIGFKPSSKQSTSSQYLYLGLIGEKYLYLSYLPQENLLLNSESGEAYQVPTKLVQLLNQKFSASSIDPTSCVYFKHRPFVITKGTKPFKPESLKQIGMVGNSTFFTLIKDSNPPTDVYQLVEKWQEGRYNCQHFRSLIH